MSEVAPVTIAGATTLTHADSLSLLLPRIVVVLTILLLMQVFFIVFYYSASGIAPIWSDPGRAIYLTFKDGVWKMLQLPAIIAALMLLFNAVQFFRLPSQNKTVSYAVDGNGITMSDAAGVSLQTPWSSVKRASKTRRHLIMNIKAGGQRFAPWRAFSPSEIDRLWTLVQLKTRTR